MTSVPAITLWDHQALQGDRLLRGEIVALWHEPRVGKTLSAIHGSRDGDRLIVCPNSVKPVWARDLALYGEPAYIWGKKRPKERPKNVIVNYETLWRTELLSYGWDSIIFDESHRLSNFRSKLFSYCFDHLKELCSARTILLSGTPCPEGYHQLIAQSILATGHFNGSIDPWEALRNAWTYDDDRYKWLPNIGTDKLAYNILQTMGHCMTQKEAGIDTRKLYRLVSVDASSHEQELWTKAMETEPEGAQYGLLAQMCASGRNMEGNTLKSAKLDQILEYIAELTEPFVLLTHFKSSLDYIRTRTKLKLGYIEGGDAGSIYRGKIIEQFNRSELQGIVANIDTVKVGLNLAHSSLLIFAENSFSGEARIQAEERCTVRGKDAVEIIDFITESDVPGLGDVDYAILSAVREKKDFNAKMLK